MAAKRTAPTLPIVTILKITPVKTPTAAPADVPKIAGSANGLFVEPCASTPAIPRHIPTKMAAPMRGARICQII